MAGNGEQVTPLVDVFRHIDGSCDVAVSYGSPSYAREVVAAHLERLVTQGVIDHAEVTDSLAAGDFHVANGGSNVAPFIGDAVIVENVIAPIPSRMTSGPSL